MKNKKERKLEEKIISLINPRIRELNELLNLGLLTEKERVEKVVRDLRYINSIVYDNGCTTSPYFNYYFNNIKGEGK